MTRKAIQVPFDEDLLERLTKLAKKTNQARVELIRKACLLFLVRNEEMELDEIYRKGYKKTPDNTEFAESQLDVLDQIFTKDEWHAPR